MTIQAVWPLLLLPLVGVVVFAGLRSGLRWPRPRLRASLILRALAAALLLFALCRPVVRAGSREVSVAFLLDVSRSVAAESIREAVAWAEEASRGLGPGNAHFIAFADRPVSVPDAGGLLGVSVFDSGAAEGRPPPGALDQGETNIEAALRHAASRFPPDRLKRLVLFSDGRANAGDAERALSLLKDGGVRIFPAPAAVRSDGGGFVNRVLAPPGVRAGEMVAVEVEVFSASGGPATLRLLRDGEPLAAVSVALPPGVSTVPVPVRLDEAGMARLEAEIEVPGDRLPLNDRRAVETPVGEAARVLYVEGQRESARYLRAALEEGGVEVETAPPASLAFLDLERWEAVVLSDIPPTELPESTMERLTRYVRDDGGGLVFAAGESSYGEDGYSDSVLEEALPVDFRIEEKWKDLSLVIVLDKSYSMYGRKIALAKEATKAALDLLEDTHRFGVVTFDWNPYTTIPLQTVADRDWIKEGISRIQASAQTNIYPALDRSYEQLTESPSKVKHVILLSDGKTYPDDYEDLVTRMQEDEITISTVAVGEEADRELLSDIAEWGDGRSYFIRDAARVQQIFVEETQIALDATLVEEPFRPVVRQQARVLDGLDFEAAPELKGFVATMAKDTAEVLLEGPEEEPLLARWQYGLGRAAMFTSDCKNRWAADWITWEGYGRFWTQVVRDAMRRGSGPEVEFEVARRGGSAEVRLSLIGEDGAFPAGASPEVEVRAAGLVGRLPVRQTGPGRFEAEVPLDLDPGGTARFRLLEESLPPDLRAPANGPPRERALHLSYPDEYRFLPADDEALALLAAETGGLVAPTIPEVLAAGGDLVVRPREAWPLLLLLALIAYLLDLSVRRTPWLWTRLADRASRLAPIPGRGVRIPGLRTPAEDRTA